MIREAVFFIQTSRLPQDPFLYSPLQGSEIVLSGELENTIVTSTIYWYNNKVTQFIFFLIIGVVGIVIGYYFSARRNIKISGSASERRQAREKNLATLRKKFASASSKKITNNEVEKLLGVSDATATRYLEALEQEGVIEQIGKEGRSVYYKAK